MRLKNWLIALVALVSVFACAKRTEQKSTAPPPAASTAPGTAATAVDVGAQMPHYTAKWLDGSTFDLASEKGNVVFLNVWATWCGPCRFEIPQLQKLHDQNASRKFKVIGVSVDEGDSSAVKDFVKEQKITYPIAVDPEGRLANLLQTSVIPTSVILDRNGRIVWKEVGSVDLSDEKMNRALEQALGR